MFQNTPKKCAITNTIIADGNSAVLIELPNINLPFMVHCLATLVKHKE